MIYSTDIRAGVAQEEEGVHGRPREASHCADERELHLQGKGLHPGVHQSPAPEGAATPTGDDPTKVFLKKPYSPRHGKFATVHPPINERC